MSFGLISSAERAAIEAQASLQTKDVIFEVESDTTGPGIKEQEQKRRREMVIDKVLVID